MECTKYTSCLFIHIQQQVQASAQSADNAAAVACTATVGDHVAIETDEKLYELFVVYPSILNSCA